MPSSPGVYWFLNADNQVLYVGKAKNLNHRLRSYSHTKQLLPKTKQLVQQTTSVHYQELDNELTALLIEAELIRTYQPTYNVLLKDDKSPLYIIITKAAFPQVYAVRKTELTTKGPLLRSFGPFPSTRQVKKVLTLARKLFPWCNAKKTNPPKACFYHHLNLCPGVCINSISTSAYKATIRQLMLFLEGKHKRIINALTKQLMQAAKTQDFETAAQLKTQIEAITYVVTHYRSTQTHPLPQLTQDVNQERLIDLKRLLKQSQIPITTLNRIEMYDVATLSGQSSTASMVVAENGQLNPGEYRHFTINTITKVDDFAMMKQAISRRLKHREWPFPDLIVVDGGKPQIQAVKSILTTAIPLIGLAKKPDRFILPIAPKTYKTIPIQDQTQPAAQLLIQLRNEAHRFARRLHHRHTNRRLLNQK